MPGFGVVVGAEERVKGIEPSPKAWEAFILPLNYTRGVTMKLASGAGWVKGVENGKPARTPGDSAKRQAGAIRSQHIIVVGDLLEAAVKPNADRVLNAMNTNFAAVSIIVGMEPPIAR